MRYLFIALFITACNPFATPSYHKGEKVQLLGFYYNCVGTVENFRNTIGCLNGQYTLYDVKCLNGFTQPLEWVCAGDIK